jgi:hypothetical protein
MMKIIFIFTAFITFISTSFADSYLGISYEKLRNWEVSFEDVPKAIHAITNLILWFATSITIIMIIVWSFKLILSSWIFWWSWDKTKAKETIINSIIWLIVAVSAWYIINLLFYNL